MTYRAPLADIGFALKHGAAFSSALDEGLFGDLTMDVVEAVLAEAGRLAGEVIAPLNRVGDTFGTPFKDGAVTTAPGWKEAYKTWRDGGWNGLAAPVEWGGQALPQSINIACIEMWNSAAMAFAVGPLLTIAAIDALHAHGSEELKRIYLEKMVTGEWTGTMQLTEPQAGSDVGALRTRAERAADGTYRIKGQKIFITYGEHDLTENIIHFVLARLPDAPPGTRGISLFLVPKFLPNADGSPGKRNDVRAHSVEHKLGIHGSPTCTMILGDEGGAVGFLIGEENAGMACMFTMMNRARLAIGVQGVGIAEAATQQALAYARDRKQGRTPGMKATEFGSPDRLPRRQAHAAHHARAHRRRARHLLFDRDGARPFRAIERRGREKGGARPSVVAHAGRQGVLHRHRQRGHLAQHPGPRRHGFCRGDRRGAAVSRCAHRRDL